jgi:hypothetical protein
MNRLSKIIGFTYTGLPSVDLLCDRSAGRTLPHALLASQLDTQLGVEMALLHVRLLSRALVEYVAAMLRSVRRLDETDVVRNGVSIWRFRTTYRVQMQADCHFSRMRVPNTMQTQRVAHIRHAICRIRGLTSNSQTTLHFRVFGIIP